MKLYKTILDNKSYECITVNLVDEDNDGYREILFELFGTCGMAYRAPDKGRLREIHG